MFQIDNVPYPSQTWYYREKVKGETLEFTRSAK